MQFDTSLGAYRVELFADRFVTTINFLGYIGRGDYNDSIIHRNARTPPLTGVPFVIQGGALSLQNGTLDFVPTQPAIQNEPGISNTRGTIAMAKVANNANSATSQWFINLDENTGLDTNNGGFTVFGRVIGNGMTVVDAIAALNTFNFGNNPLPTAELPLRDYTQADLSAGKPVTVDNLVFTNLSVVPDVAPIFTSIADTPAPRGQALSVDLAVTDGDLPREELTFSLVTGPAGATIQKTDANHVRLTWTPALNQPLGSIPTTLRVRDLSGKTAETSFSVIVTEANEPPTVSIDDLPVSNAGFDLSQVTFVFSEAVTGVDLADFQLTRNGASVPLTGAQLSTTDNVVYTLGNLGGITNADGGYRFSIVASGSGITDSGAAPLGLGTSRYWRNLGTVLQAPLIGESVSAEGSQYHLRLGFGGLITAEFALNPAQGVLTSMQLSNVAGGVDPTPNIAPDGSNGRVDYQAAAGSAVVLTLRGNTPSVNVRASNVLELDDANRRATVHGRAVDDKIRLSLAGTNVQVDYNGDLQYTAGLGTYNSVGVMGAGGANAVTLLGTASAETAELGAGSGFLAGIATVSGNPTNYRLEALDAERLLVEAGGGADAVTLRGTAGDDLLVLQPSRFSAGASAGVAVANGFAQASVIPGSGGTDRVIVYDSAGADQFDVTPTGFTGSGAGYSLSGQGVASLWIHAGHGDDVLTWTGSGAADQVLTRPGNVQVTSSAFRGVFTGFREFSATAGATASLLTFLDSTSTDLFFASPALSTFISPGYVYSAAQYGKVRGLSQAGSDVAAFTSPNGQFQTSGGTSTLTTATATISAVGFASVVPPDIPPVFPPGAAASNFMASGSGSAAESVDELFRYSLAMLSASELVDAALDDESDWW